MEGVEHLKDTLRGVFADIDAPAEHLASGIEDDELHIGAVAGKRNSIGELPEEGFIQEIVFGAVSVMRAMAPSMRNFTYSN